MMVCSSCSAELAADSTYCAECGAALGTLAGDGDQAAHPLLAKANLERMRGMHSQAEAHCLSVLKKFPRNVAAHVLLGDIHAELGDRRQALQWYDLAADLNGDDPALSKKIADLRSEEGREAAAAAVDGLEVEPSARMTFLAFAIAILLLVGVAATSFVIGRKRSQAIDEAKVDQFIRPVSIGETAPTVRSGSASEPKPDVASPEPIAAEPSAMTPEESALAAELSGKLGTNGPRVLGVEIDARTGAARLTVAASGPSGDQDAVDAASSAAALLETRAATPKCDVRVLDPSTRAIRLTGTVTRESIAAAQGQLGPAAILDAFRPQ